MVNISAKNKQSPFKLWDAYGKKDKDIFFGRDREIKTLYEKTFASNLLLIYGVSGTGKTSLIGCGLGNMFEETDWLPILIRRGDDMTQSITNALQEKTKYKSKMAHKPIKDMIHQLFLEYFRPVFLIFDQFEELFILGQDEEENRFFALLPDLLEANFQCKVIISIREDYLAYLDPFEDQIPSLFYNRFRVERMRTEQLEEVILKTAEKFDINLAPSPPKNLETAETSKQKTLSKPTVQQLKPEEVQVDTELQNRIIHQIIDNVKNEHDQVDLVDLQVYMDHLYRKDLQRQFAGKGALQAQIQFDEVLIKQAGRIDQVLGLLLEEQLLKLDDELKEKGADQPNIPLHVLAELVTYDATKQVREVSEIRDTLRRKKRINPKFVDHCIQRLIEMRILKQLKK